MIVLPLESWSSIFTNFQLALHGGYFFNVEVGNIGIRYFSARVG